MYEQIVAWWQTKNIQTDADLEEAFNGHVISFAYNSGNIENPNVTYHDTREIFEHDGVTSYTGDIRTLFEIRNAKLANEYFFAAFNERKPIDENLIKEIQKRLTLNTYDPLRWKKGERPREYKKGDYVTGKNETGAWPEDVPDEMQELIEDIGDKNALTAAAFFHAKFENIHPFAYGNGRTGRLVMTMASTYRLYSVSSLLFSRTSLCSSTVGANSSRSDFAQWTASVSSLAGFSMHFSPPKPQ